jgi:hypothetical protein
LANKSLPGSGEMLPSNYFKGTTCLSAPAIELCFYPNLVDPLICILVLVGVGVFSSFSTEFCVEPSNLNGISYIFIDD